MKKIFFITLGCKVNQCETDMMAGLFQAKGYTILDEPAQADVILVNTCAVTSLGEKKSRQTIRKMQRENETACFVVTGCYAQIAPNEIEKLGIDLVIGTKHRENIVEMVETCLREKKKIRDIEAIMQTKNFEDIPLLFPPKRTRAFLKIQEGCQNFCSYCIIPYTRGALRSRPMASIKKDIETLLNEGFREIVLTGIHLGAYGFDFDKKILLADVTEMILNHPLAKKNLSRLRLGSLESIEVSEKLLAQIKNDSRMAKHLHLSLQAGSDEILKLMNRHYTLENFAALLKNIREKVPDIAITTDIIVGFPNETEEIFEKSLEFIQRQNFARIHVFPYSRRPNTPADRMPNQIDAQTKKNRVKRLQAVAQKSAQKFLEIFLQKTEEVLFETVCEIDGEKFFDGLTTHYTRVFVPKKNLDEEKILGNVFAVKLTEIFQDGMKGELLE